jgi:hypothetical protein
MPKRYRVLNPSGVPKGVPVMHFKGKDYFEGDVFTPPRGMRLDRVLAQGYVEEVKGDG